MSRTNEVVLAVQAVSANEAPGLDGIVSKHLLYSSQRCCTMFGTSGLSIHVELPDSMLTVVLVPIIKDKIGRIDRMDNNKTIAACGVYGTKDDIVRHDISLS